MISVSELVGKTVRTESGKSIGQVREVRAKNNRVDMLICGTKGFMQRIYQANTGRRVKWQKIRRVTCHELICSD
jgi:sporulation protein YlmC with PRC-barrel domain